MTIASSINRIAYTGDGVATGYAFPFRIFAASDLRVYLDGVLQSAGYTVTGVDAPSGTVNFTAAPGSGVSVVLVRQVPAVQETDFADLGPFPAEASERAHDRAVVLAQQNADGLALAIRFPEFDTAPSPVLPSRVARAGGFPAFDANGDLTVVQAQPAGPGLTEAYWWGGTAGGTANAQTITVASPPAAYSSGQRFNFLAVAANTGATTLNVNGLGAVPVRKGDGSTALTAGDITGAGAAVSVVYESGGGGRFRLLNVGTSAPDLSAYARKDQAQTFTEPQTIAKNATGDLLTVTSTDAGATAGALRLRRQSSSPAANDELMDLIFGGRDDAAADRSYARLRTLLRNPAAASAEGELALSVLLAGALVDALRLRNGVVVGGASGGFQGTGTVNASGYYRDGVAFNGLEAFESVEQTITLAGPLVIPHGLTGKPRFVQAVMVCKVADLGYSIGDEVFVNPSVNSDGAQTNGGLSIVPDATNLNVRYGANTPLLIRKDTGVGAFITALSSWRYVFRAWR